VREGNFGWWAGKMFLTVISPLVITAFLSLFYFFKDKVSLWSPCWPWTLDPPLSASQVLGL
jgi:hypothetical protein